jgi:hypothetical protein
VCPEEGDVPAGLVADRLKQLSGLLGVVVVEAHLSEEEMSLVLGLLAEARAVEEGANDRLGLVEVVTVEEEALGAVEVDLGLLGALVDRLHQVTSGVVDAAFRPREHA